MGPPAHLLSGQVGAEKWHKDTRTTVQDTTKLTKYCGKEALDLWRPVRAPGEPEETPYERKLRKDSWKFKLDILASGEVNTKPPEGPGVTLWKSKFKPPPWVTKIALSCFRDFTNTKNNEFVAQYTRATRLVVSRLRQAFIEINEQVKTLVRVREQLDATLAKIRQSLITNKQSQAIREHRPTSEKISDKVDALMKWEKEEFLKTKAKLEGMMAMSEDHLKQLGTCRQTLDMLCGERGRVLDLLPQPLRMILLEAGRDSWLGLSRPSSPWVERNQTPTPDPIGPFTPECEAALEDARRLTFLSKDVLLKLQEVIHEAQNIRNTAHNSIESSLQGKRDETLCHKERLDMALAGTRGTLHRCQRFQHEMRVTRGMALGPESSKYLETREKLTRPVVKVYQRHVGTQLPEPAILNQSTAELDRSIVETEKNIQQLHGTRRYLRQCIHEKQTGYEVDGSIKRLRQRRIHPRTCLQETLQLVYT
ncbi:coiled-coil domain-containing protein 105 [Hemicordylus capensis]|uniref:coiled-coil domain-containing protein 105 n=1 Tax=Hemicordylus capensis TaxID=884348 RepID=UPI00230215C9|nr:coiled-coil domain-containing protein 105 [Hemicordylus capensis]XP_053155868.1 coiled-coil domain-containing protein 105 [Hemicordylus capensis]